MTASLSSSAPWLPDRGDGTYRNPVLFADYSDPDAIRVGEDYWLVASSFCHVPGLPILHSRDLVNWTLVNHALPRLVPVEHFSVPRHGQGVWAPSIRFHAGRFWIFYPDPDFGLYIVTADDPLDRWSAPVLVKAGKGLIDPCPFWDEDGQGYLIHGWAKSRAGINNRLTLHRLTDDNRSVADAGEIVIDGDQLPGWHTLEGPKLYRRGEYYYIFAPAGGVGEGYQAVFRSHNIRGPYEHRIVLAQGRTAINGPHQGAWVDTPEGTHWFVHFQERSALGRVVHLQPMRWVDGWPQFGVSHSVDGHTTGEPVASGALPRALGLHPMAPATSDEFMQPEFGRQWQWQANPQPGWASLTARPGWLRLACVAQSVESTLWGAPHLLMQKFPAADFVATAKVELSSRRDGDEAGLVVFGLSYFWLGLRQRDGALRLVLVRCDDAHEEGRETEVASVPVNSPTLHLRVAVQGGVLGRFSFGADGVHFTEIGAALALRSSLWVGAKIGLFARTLTGGAGVAGWADVDWFRIVAGL